MQSGIGSTSSHGLEGDIRHGGNVNKCCDEPYDVTGHFDLVLAKAKAAEPAINLYLLLGRGSELGFSCDVGSSGDSPTNEYLDTTGCQRQYGSMVGSASPPAENPRR